MVFRKVVILRHGVIPKYNGFSRLVGGSIHHRKRNGGSVPLLRELESLNIGNTVRHGIHQRLGGDILGDATNLVRRLGGSVRQNGLHSKSEIHRKPIKFLL
jgi:hypothetical protein